MILPTAGISTRLPAEYGPGIVAVHAGLDGATPGGVLRYLAYRLAGLSESAAKERVIPRRNLSAFNSRPREEVTQVPSEVLNDIRANHGDVPIAWLLRYQAAKEAGANDELARHIADSVSRGRPNGSKDFKPRIRRTNAEIAAAREAATT
jgi:hypothetical protein